MHTTKHIVFLLIFTLSLHFAFAQKSFKGGIILGAATCQTNGDDIGGFHKIGVTAGGFVSREIAPQMSIDLELRFTQKGAGDPNGYFKLNTGYVEVPVLFSYSFYQDFALKAGVGFAVEMYESTEIGGYKSNPNDLQNFDIPAYIGVGYNIKERFGFDLRASMSALPIRGHISGRNYHHICLYASAHIYIVK